MKTVSLLLLIASTALAQDGSIAVDGAKYLIRVQAVDTTTQATMRIAIKGDLFASLGASKARSGSVHLGPDGGTGTGTVLGSLFERPGRLTFSSDEVGRELELQVTSVTGGSIPRLVARGRSVSVVCTEAGVLSVEARQ